MTEVDQTPRPRLLRPITLLMCVCLLDVFAFYSPKSNFSPTAHFAIYVWSNVVFSIIALVILWYFWRGRNWARWMVLAGSLLTLVSLYKFPTANRLQQGILAMEALLAIWLIYWLNTKQVAAYFTQHGAKAQRVNSADEGSLRWNHKIVGWYLIVSAVFGIALMIFWKGTQYPGFPKPKPVVIVVGYVLAAIFKLADLVAGIGILKQQRWARIVAVVFFVLSAWYGGNEAAWALAHGRPTPGLLAVGYAIVIAWEGAWIWFLLYGPAKRAVEIEDELEPDETMSDVTAQDMNTPAPLVAIHIPRPTRRH